MRKPIRLLVTLLLSSLVASGCWDRREINDVAYVLTTAVDKEQDQYRLSVQIPLPGQMGSSGRSGGGGGTSGDKSWYADSATGRSIREVHVNLQRSLSRRLNFSHRRVVLVGEEMARSGISPVIDAIARVPQNRLTGFLVIAKGTAQEVLNTDAPMEQFPSEMMRELAQNSMNRPQTVKHFTEMLLTDGVDPYAPTVEMFQTKPGGKSKPKTSVRITGISVFGANTGLVGILNQDQSLAALLLMNQARDPVVTVAAPKNHGDISVRIQDTNTTLIPSINGKELKLKIVFRAAGNVEENESTLDVASNANWDKLEKTVTDKITRDIMDVMSTLQKDLKSDPVGVGRRFYEKYPHEWAQMRKDWMRYYSEVKIEPDVQVHIEHLGIVTLPLGRKDGELTR